MVYKFYDEKSREVVLPLLLQVNLLPNQIINLQMNFIGRSLKNLREEKFFIN